MKLFDLETAIKYSSKFSFDTRTINKGSIFIALNGKEQKIDGHNFVIDAINKGADYCIVKQGFKLEDEAINKNLLYCSGEYVLDYITQIASQKIEYLKQQNANIVTITGSVGKTTTKNLIKFICDKLYGNNFCYATLGNYNNFIGLPFTILQAPVDAKLLALEIGMDKFGEIDHLASIAKPHIAIITQIGESHLQNFKNKKEIAIAKGECIKHANALILNNSIKFLSVLKNICKQFNKNIIFTKLKIRSLKIDSLGQTSFYLAKSMFDKNKINIKILKPLTKDYLQNLLLAVETITNLYLKDLKKIETIDFNEFFNSGDLKGRGMWSKLVVNGHTSTLIDESYNASPKSMKNSIKTLSYLKKANKAIIIGDMLELGNDELKMHEELAFFIKKAKPKIVICIGVRMKALFNKIKYQKTFISQHFSGIDKFISQDEDLERLKQFISEAKIDFVLVKSSNGTKLSKIIDIFRNSPQKS